MHVGIVGAGPGGLFASIALANTGHDVVVFEQAQRQEDVGAGIQISPNGTRLLAHHGLLEALQNSAFEPEATVLQRADTGKLVFRTPMGQSASKRYGAPYLHLHRADLVQVLHAAAIERGIKIQNNARVAKFVNTSDSINIHLEGSTTQTFDLLVGADGIHSAVRTQMLGPEQARFTGNIAWRGLVPAERIDPDLIAPDTTVWAGSGQHFVHYFVRGGSLINFVAVKEHDYWAEESWSMPGNLDHVRTAFNGWSPGITQLLGSADTCHLWGLFDRPPLARWTGQRIALLGDACHPMLPFMAQGAVMAFEDAVILSRTLASADNIQTALEHYEAIRKPRTTRIQERARRNGHLFHQHSALKRNLTLTPLALINQLAPDIIARRLDWIYGYDACAVDVERII